MNQFDEIHKKRQERVNAIFKGIEGGEEMLEKARQVGDTKVGKDGITRVWTKTPSGFDWRRSKGDNKSGGKGAAKPVDKKETKETKKKEEKPAKESANVKKGKKLIDQYEKLSKKEQDFESKVREERSKGNGAKANQLEEWRDKTVDRMTNVESKLTDLYPKLTQDERDELTGHYGFDDLWEHAEYVHGQLADEEKEMKKPKETKKDEPKKDKPKETKKESVKKLSDLNSSYSSGGKTFKFESQLSDDNVSFFEARGSVVRDEYGDEWPDSKTMDAAEAVASSIRKEGYDVEVVPQEKGWVSVVVEEKKLKKAYNEDVQKALDTLGL